MTFKTPLLLLLIPVFIILYFYLGQRSKDGAFRFSSTAFFKSIAPSWKMRFWFVPGVIKLVGIVLWLFALAGPRFALDQAKITTEGIDIVLAIDCSGSMASEDFIINGHRQNRLAVIKSVVKEFIDARNVDRIGLVAFAGKAYTVCPLTTDYAWLKSNLDRITLGVIEDGTAIGSGIASSLARLEGSQAKTRIVILLTDGVNNAGSIAPLPAAQLAKPLRVRVYTIGAGSKGFAPFPVRDFFGNVHYQNIPSELDEDTLKKIAQVTEGQYFRATDTDSLRQIYKQIDAMEKTKVEHTGYKEYKELFGYFLVAAMVLLLVEVILSSTVFLKIP